MMMKTIPTFLFLILFCSNTPVHLFSETDEKQQNKEISVQMEMDEEDCGCEQAADDSESENNQAE